MPDFGVMNDFLFARSSLLEGVGRNIDLFGALDSYNGSVSGRAADLKAMRYDIAALRRDFLKAYGSVIKNK